MIVFYRSAAVTEIPSDINYARQLRQAKTYFQLENGYFAISNCDERGCLLKTFRILELKSFHNDDGEIVKLYLCRCNSSHFEWLQNISSITRENITSFEEREKKKSCIHCKQAYQLWPVEEICNSSEISDQPFTDEEEVIVVNRLTVTPLHVAVYDGNSYGIVTKWRSGFKCTTCISSVTSCTHVKEYKAWLRLNEVEEAVDLENNEEAKNKYDCISQSRISYPLTDSLCDRFRLQEESNIFPKELIPAITDLSCPHGNHFSKEDPRVNGWVVTKRAKIHKKAPYYIRYNCIFSS